MAKPDNIRNRAREMLPILMRRQKARCKYCGCRMVMDRTVKPEHVVKKTAHFVQFIRNGVIHAAARATVEHVKPISEGGGNLNGNIVAACARCNAYRAKGNGPSGNYCPTCGVAISKKRKQCRPCVKGSRLAAHIYLKRNTKPTD